MSISVRSRIPLVTPNPFARAPRPRPAACSWPGRPAASTPGQPFRARRRSGTRADSRAAPAAREPWPPTRRSPRRLPQALTRPRHGQHRNVLVRKFVTSGTIEEKIELMLTEKRQLTDELIDGDGEVGLTELPDDELLDLVRLDVTRAAP